MKPRLLDLFCGAGGAAMGYARAGFEVVGVDNRPQPRYPFEFVQADALEYLRDLLDCSRLPEHDYSHWGWDLANLSAFDAIHASPPCQGYSRMRHLPWLRDKEYERLIEPTRELLEATGLPWVMENVEDAPMPHAPTLTGNHGFWLCGLMFGLPLYRHRLFESNLIFEQPTHPKHRQVILGGRLLNKRYSQGGSAGVAGVLPPIVTVAGHTSGMMQFAPQAMGIDWMQRDELTEAIPPAYTEFIGPQLLDHLRARTAA